VKTKGLQFAPAMSMNITSHANQLSEARTILYYSTATGCP